MSQEFRERESREAMRPTTIGRLGMVSLALTLIAAFGALCCFGPVGLVLGIIGMVGGFACFYLSRKAGSKRDLIVGIMGMITGFLIVAYVVYDMRLDASATPSPGFGITESIIKMGGPQPLFGDDDEADTVETTPREPFAAPEKSLPQPTRPATREKRETEP